MSLMHAVAEMTKHSWFDTKDDTEKENRNLYLLCEYFKLKPDCRVCKKAKEVFMDGLYCEINNFRVSCGQFELMTNGTMTCINTRQEGNEEAKTK